MESDPKKLAMIILGKGGGGEKPETGMGDEGEGAGDESSGSGADAFSSAVKLAMKGDKDAAFDALKVAVSQCSSEDYD